MLRSLVVSSILLAAVGAKAQSECAGITERAPEAMVQYQILPDVRAAQGLWPFGRQGDFVVKSSSRGIEPPFLTIRADGARISFQVPPGEPNLDSLTGRGLSRNNRFFYAFSVLTDRVYIWNVESGQLERIIPMPAMGESHLDLMNMDLERANGDIVVAVETAYGREKWTAIRNEETGQWDFRRNEAWVRLVPGHPLEVRMIGGEALRTLALVDRAGETKLSIEDVRSYAFDKTGEHLVVARGGGVDEMGGSFRLETYSVTTFEKIWGKTINGMVDRDQSIMSHYGQPLAIVGNQVFVAVAKGPGFNCYDVDLKAYGLLSGNKVTLPQTSIHKARVQDARGTYWRTPLQTGGFNASVGITILVPDEGRGQLYSLYWFNGIFYGAADVRPIQIFKRWDFESRNEEL